MWTTPGRSGRLSVAVLTVGFSPQESEKPMCWRCDNPEATEADYFRLIRKLIDRDGWFIQGVEKTRARPAFTYTVGLTLHGHPELLVTGMPSRRATQFLNDQAHALLHHAAPPFKPGDSHLWPDDLLIEVVAVAQPSVHLVMAHGMFGPGIRAVQLVYADDRGRWPWQVGFRGNQAVLGPRNAQ